MEVTLHLLPVVINRNRRNVKLRLVVHLNDAAGVGPALVQFTQRPVVTDNLVPDRIDELFVVEVVQLMRQDLADRVEEKRADSQDLGVDAVSHHLGHLPVLVALDVNAAVDGERCELLILLTLGHVLVAVNALVLEEDCTVLVGAPDVVEVCAANFETLHGGPVLFADLAVQVGAILQGRFDVDQSAVLSLVNFFGPQGTVQMDPLVDVVVEKPGRAVSRSVAFHVAEEALAGVVSVSWRHDRDAHLTHHRRQVILVQLLVAFLCRRFAGSRQRIVELVSLAAVLKRILFGSLATFSLLIRSLNLDHGHLLLLLFLPLLQLVQVRKRLSVRFSVRIGLAHGEVEVAVLVAKVNLLAHFFSF